jgi:hypothetical protein
VPVRRTATVGAVALCLALAGCGGSAPPPRPAGPVPAGLASAVLGFWHALGAHRYRSAYDDLGPPVRRSLTFKRFSARAAHAHVVFARIPRVARVQGRGKVRTVYVASARADLSRADAVQVIFTVRRYAAGWRIVEPPFRTEAARARRRAIRRAPRRGGSRAAPRA